MALSAADGRIRWQVPGSDMLPALLNGESDVLCSGSVRGNVTAMNVLNDSARWRVSIGWHSVVYGSSHRAECFMWLLQMTHAQRSIRTQDTIRWWAMVGDAGVPPVMPVSTTILVTGLLQ